MVRTIEEVKKFFPDNAFFNPPEIHMFCPLCETELIVKGQEKLETLCDHVLEQTPTLKDAYGCPNLNCELYHDNAIWGPDGDYYGGKELFKKYRFKQGLKSAIGSFSRRMDIESYRGENHNLLTIGKVIFYLKYDYKADDKGNIVQRIPKIEVHIRSKDGSAILYMSGIRMLLFCIREFKREKERYLRNEYNQLKDSYNEGVWHDTRWWKILAAQYLKIRHPFLRYRYLKEKKAKES